MTSWNKVFGPGLLFAATAIGVSHLVQSTRAGADYGYGLLWAIVLANVLKFPFFEFGSRYANATGTSTLDGFRSWGKWGIVLYLVITVLSMFAVTAAVSLVTTGLLADVLGLQWPVLSVTALIFTFCILALLKGKYRALDGLIKMMGVVLVATTVIALAFSFSAEPKANPNEMGALDFLDQPGGVLFVIALMGWMPTAVDLSAWNSLWTVEQMKKSGYRPTLKQTLIEFHLGYWISAALALAFVVLGARVMFGSAETFSNSPTAFSHQLIAMYAEVLGNWSIPILGICALSVMFSTTLSVFDGYARSWSRSLELLSPKMRWKYQHGLWLTAIGGLVVIAFFQDKMKHLVDLATTVSFLIAPIIAAMNWKLVNGNALAPHQKPGKWMNLWALFGFIFLVFFSIWYVLEFFH